MFNMNLIFSLRIFSFLIIILAAGAAHARTADLKDPDPIPIRQGISFDQAQNAAKGAVLQMGWTINKVITENPRVEEIEYRIRSHSMSLTLGYSTDVIKLKYLASENLNYKSTKQGMKIHPNYNVWAQQLADQIASNLAGGSHFKLVEVTPQKAVNPPPKEAFKNFDQIVFESVTLDGDLNTKKNK